MPSEIATRSENACSLLTQIYRYTQAFHSLQNPLCRLVQEQPWVLWLHDLPDHPCIQHMTLCDAEKQVTVYQPNGSLLQQHDTSSVTSSSDYILKVKRPTLSQPPQPPTAIAPRLYNAWHEVDGRVILDAKAAAHFNNDVQGRTALDRWVSDYQAWTKTESAARKVMDLFDRFYALRAQLERESERLELMIGDGILDWYPSECPNGMHHPLLLRRVHLQFSPHIPAFTITVTDQPPEFYTVLFQEISSVEASRIKEYRQAFEQQALDPLGGSDTSQFLQQLVYQLSSRGEFSASAISHAHQQYPLITRDPVLFLRPRTLGYNTAFEAILEHLPTQEHLPEALLALTGIVQIDHPAGQIAGPSLHGINDEYEHILFCKPANAEQIEIARRLDSHNAVLVQGPPGTGKTHTIANLLGHLLAQGKSVLVTSHTSKALNVLHEKIIEPLQPLCVSILEDNSRKQMEKAIDAITNYLAFANVHLLEREVAQLQQQRLNTIVALRKAREELKEACGSEYRDIVLAGQSYPPAEAARYVTTHHANAGWIPAPVTLGTPLPLTSDELVNLYRTNGTVSPLNEQEINACLPDPQQLASPPDFEQAVLDHHRLGQKTLDFRRDLWTQRVTRPSPLDLEHLSRRLSLATLPLMDTSNDRGWRLAAIAAGRDGGAHQQLWNGLLAKITAVELQAVHTQQWLLTYDPSLPDESITPHTKNILNEIIAHFDAGGKLGVLPLLLHRDWKMLIACARVQGRPPTQREHFIALLLQLQLRDAREDLVRRWQRQMIALGAIDIAAHPTEPEHLCKQYIPQVLQCLAWFNSTWKPLEHELKQLGFDWETLLSETPMNLAEHGDLLRLCEAIQQQFSPILAAEINRRLYAANDDFFQALRKVLQSVNRLKTPAIVVQHLLQAVQQYNAPLYQEAYHHVVDLHAKRAELQIRQLLLSKLQGSAPRWTAALDHREGLHGNRELPGDPQQAWLWRQLHDTLDHLTRTSLEVLQERCVQLQATLQTITAELVAKKAWAAQVRRTTPEQRRALQGWKEIMRKVGKGTGKRAPRLLAEAQRLMPICQSAVPVWIMPLSHVVQNFDPRRTHFDVIIIDEASQADIKALAILYMGKQVLIVGDDEQVTPMAVGQKLDYVDKLIDEYLHGVPQAAVYDGRLSMYALAKISGYEPICLREHFRCVSPIIQFSNALSYDGKIKPLRDDSDVVRRPATVAYRVRSFEALGHVNEEEAQTVASLLVAATEQSAYHDATFGVISLVRDEQAMRIDTLLQKHLPETAYTRHHILCGSPAHFQGDERDVIFLSLVDVPAEHGPLSLRSEDAYEYMYKKRYNVAASRARDQLWVVHSLDPLVDLKDGDIRKRLILHAKNASTTASLQAQQGGKLESEFERQVFKKLQQAGYHVVAQWPVGAYRIDLVVEGDGKRLAVECDGDRWHPIEKLEEDMARQAILERLGWRFVRIRGSHFFRHPDQAMEPVFARLRTLEIPPTSLTSAPEPTTQKSAELLDSIIRRATELRNSWEENGVT
jgi:very-short-patch-repair endonuclease/DNA polymerase III delta prime subunit